MNDDVEIVHIITEPTRFAILCLLIDHNYCVRALARKLNISEPAISQHMNVFKRYDLVTWKKLGYQVHYHVKRERVVQALSGLTSVFNLNLEGYENELNRACTCEFADECSCRRKRPSGEEQPASNDSKA